MFCLLLLLASAWAQVTYRVVLVGDGGLAPGGDPAAEALHADMRARLAEAPDGAVVWLGDNVYRGLGGGARRAADHHADAMIAAQVAGWAPGRPIHMVPGNHDWGQFPWIFWRRGGWQAAQVAAHGGLPVAYPSGTGPRREVWADHLLEWRDSDGVRWVFLDSERIIKALWQGRDVSAALEDYGKVVGSAPPGALVLVAMHHPVANRGHHGTLDRAFACVGGNLGCPGYLAFVEALAARPAAEGVDLVFASGHEHGVDVVPAFPGGRAVQIVSGAVAKGDRAEVHAEGMSHRPGYVLLDHGPDGWRIRRVTADAAGRIVLGDPEPLGGAPAGAGGAP